MLCAWFACKSQKSQKSKKNTTFWILAIEYSSLGQLQISEIRSLRKKTRFLRSDVWNALRWVSFKSQKSQKSQKTNTRFLSSVLWDTPRWIAFQRIRTTTWGLKLEDSLGTKTANKYFLGSGWAGCPVFVFLLFFSKFFCCWCFVFFVILLSIFICCIKHNNTKHYSQQTNNTTHLSYSENHSSG